MPGGAVNKLVTKEKLEKSDGVNASRGFRQARPELARPFFGVSARCDASSVGSLSHNLSITQRTLCATDHSGLSVGSRGQCTDGCYKLELFEGQIPTANHPAASHIDSKLYFFPLHYLFTTNTETMHCASVSFFLSLLVFFVSTSFARIIGMSAPASVVHGTSMTVTLQVSSRVQLIDVC